VSRFADIDGSAYVLPLTCAVAHPLTRVLGDHQPLQHWTQGITLLEVQRKIGFGLGHSTRSVTKVRTQTKSPDIRRQLVSRHINDKTFKTDCVGIVSFVLAVSGQRLVVDCIDDRQFQIEHPAIVYVF
jgi:hypothetical protein